MRITEFEKKIIKNAIIKLDGGAEIFLFGSRTDDEKKGGDIDILVISDKIDISDVIDIKFEIFKHLEEQKIDIIVKNTRNDPFVEIVMEKAFPL